MVSLERDPSVEYVSEVFDDWLRVELSHAKYSCSHSNGRHWGRAVIRSIDLDDSIMLYSSLTKGGAAVMPSDQHQLIADRINTQVDCLGYAEYLWTASIHRFLGDTALHLAIRQRKMRCVHMLLLLEADVHIKNAADETAHLMVGALLHTTVRELRFEAVRFILRNTAAKDIGRFPDMNHLRFQRIEKEAWDLMKAGRIMYSAPPSTLSKADLALKRHVASARTKHLSINTSAVEAEEQHRSEQDQALVSATDSQIAPSGPPSWVQMSDADGNQYFYNEETCESSWDNPAHTLEHESAEPLQEQESSKVEVGAAAAAVTPVSIGGDGVKGSRRARAKAKADRLLIEAVSMVDNGTSSITDQPPEEVPIVAAQPIVLSKVAALRDQYGDRPVSKVTALRVEIESLKQEAAARSEEVKVQRIMNDAAMMTVLHEEIDRINKGIEVKATEYRQALAVLNDDDRKGASSTPAGKMGPDVWGRDQLIDMVRLLERQKQRRTKTLLRTTTPVARGLTLLDSVRASSSMQGMGRPEEELLPGGVRDLYLSEQTVQRLETLKQLKFVDTSKLLLLSHHHHQQQQQQQSKLHQSSEKQMNSNGAQPNVADYAQASRDITRLSTYSNLKHYNIGDAGIRALSAVLDGDCIVQHLCLAGARITSSGILSFAEVAPNIRRLSYLDLSSNAICDVGAKALSEALPRCDLLATCLLSGNRIGIDGLVLLVQWAMKSQSVGFCGLQNNELGRDDLQLVEKLMDEHDYSCRAGGADRVYLKSNGSAPHRCKLMRGGTDDDNSMIESSSSSSSSSVKKIVL